MKSIRDALPSLSVAFLLLFPCQRGHAAYDPLTSGILGAIIGLGDDAARKIELERQLEFQKELIREEYRIKEEYRIRQNELERQRHAKANELNKETEDVRQNSVSTGTGFFIATNGYLVTNAHVVNGYENISIKDQYGRTLKATVIASDKKRDLALLKVSGNYPALHISQTDGVSKGQRVMTIGYPQPTIQGSESKVTDGVISSFTGLKDNDNWFQISVPIQGGNSGGPLINEDGTVIGVVVATLNAKKFLSITGNIPQNVNYAIKSKVLLDFLIEHQILNINSSNQKTSINAVDQSTVLIISMHEANSSELSMSTTQEFDKKVDNEKLNLKSNDPISKNLPLTPLKNNELVTLPGGKITFLRKSSFYEAMQTTKLIVSVDGKLIGAIAEGTYVISDVPVGTHQISGTDKHWFYGSIGGPCKYELNVTTGQQHFVLVNLSGKQDHTTGRGPCGFEAISEAEALGLIGHLKKLN